MEKLYTLGEMQRSTLRRTCRREWLDQPAERWLVHGGLLLAIVVLGPFVGMGLFLGLVWVGGPLRSLGLPDLWSFVLSLAFLIVAVAWLRPYFAAH
jgi:hypothetical protein